MGRPRQPIRHGTEAGFVAHHRRQEAPCDTCKAAHAEKQRAYREQNRAEIAEKQRAYREQNRAEIAEKKRAYYEQNRAEIAEKPDDPRHGTIHAYNNLACRCDRCKQAARDYRTARPR